MEVAMAKVAKSSAVQISNAVHAALTARAADETLKRGKRVTIKDLVEEAVLGHWPAMRQAPGVVTVVDGIEQHNELLVPLLTAAFTSADPVESNAAIEQLKGEVSGSFGQKIKLKDLAYHLRSATNSIATMRDLITDYEGTWKTK
jgi:hypothetical protein